MPVPKELESKYNEIMDISVPKSITDAAYEAPDYLDENGEKTENPVESEKKEETTKQTETESTAKKDAEKPKTSVPEKPDNSKQSDEEFEEIPERLVSAGRSVGLSDEQIINTSNEVLEVLAKKVETTANRVQSETQGVAEKIAPPVVEKQSENLKHIELPDLSTLDPETIPVIKNLVTTQNLLIDQLNRANEKLGKVDTVATEIQQQKQDDFDRQIDGIFDRIEDVPAIGKSDNLNQSNLKIRQMIFGMAAAIKSHEGGSIESSIQKATKAYKGINSQDAINTLRRQINDSKKRFSPRPTGRRITPEVKPEQERALGVITDKLREFGIE